jgi:myo-inositol-1(or 4)-monophosphatase
MFDPDLDGLLLLATDTVKRAVENVLKDPPIIKEMRLDLDKDIKLEADYKLEKFIIDNIAQQSGYPILAEECGIVNGSGTSDVYRWIIDPLDGSLNYYRGIPMSCLSIGLWKEMDPILGVVFDFNHGETFTGLVGKGAWLNGRPIRLSDVTEKSKAVLCTGFPVSTDFSKEALIDFVEDIRNFKKIRLLGSAALSLAYVACGRADCYRENGIKIWDVAAGLALVKAAGGIVRINPSNNDVVLNVEASNAKLSLIEKAIALL